MKSIALAAAFTVVALGSAAQAAPNLVTNGSFETSTQTIGHEFGASFIYGQSVTGWTSASTTAFNLWFPNALNATTVDASTRFSEPGQYLWNLPGPVPDGLAFVALDGDVLGRGPLTQLITGLTIGATYNLSFDWAAAQYRDRVGVTTERLDVGFGAQSFSTATVINPSMSSKGWFTVNHKFTATSTSQLLSFLSIGTPSGLPPVALLDNVSLTAVPEPASWALMIAGFGGVGAMARRRRRTMATAA